NRRSREYQEAAAFLGGATERSVAAGTGAVSEKQRGLQEAACLAAAADPPEPGEMEPADPHRAAGHARSLGHAAQHDAGAAPAFSERPATEVETDAAGAAAVDHGPAAHASGHDPGREGEGAERSEVHAGPLAGRAIHVAGPEFADGAACAVSVVQRCEPA